MVSFSGFLFSNALTLTVLISLPSAIIFGVWVYRKIREMSRDVMHAQYDIAVAEAQLDELQDFRRKHQEMLDRMAAARAAKAAKKQAAQVS